MADWKIAGAKGLTPRGLNDGDMESFRGSPVRSLAREICQNSLDARRADLFVADPVVVTYNSFSAKVPGRDTLLENICKMREYWRCRQKSDKAVIDVLNRALELLQAEEIPFLRISDYNTTGLVGVGKEGSPWDNLVISVGVSDKGANAGGSKGIGHAAPFACTDLQTVFYSTKNAEERGINSAFEGVSRMVGYKDDDGITFNNIAYYGDGECGQDPLTCDVELERGYVRSKDKTGTDIYIAGFRRPDWERDIIRATVDSFLLAIYKGNLEIQVGELVINQKTLGSVIDKVQEELPGHAGFSMCADQYYKVLTAGSARVFTKVIEDPEMQGVLKLHLLVDPNVTRRKVAMIRDTGMLIFERHNISSSINFAGVMEIEGEGLNGYLRRLENPAHTEWSEQRADDPAKAARLMKDILHFCKDSLKRMISISPNEKIDSGLGDSLPLGDGNNDGTRTAEDISDEYKPLNSQVVALVRTPMADAKKTSSEKKNGQEASQNGELVAVGAGGSSSDGRNEGTGGTGAGGTLEGESPGRHEEPRRFTSVTWASGMQPRFICMDVANGRYVLRFVPAVKRDQGVVRVFVSAEGENFPADVLSARKDDGGELEVVKSSKFTEIRGVRFEKNVAVVVNLHLNYSDYTSLELEAYGC